MAKPLPATAAGKLYMQIYGTFYGYEQRTNVTRLFKIYATDQGLLGGWIAPFDFEEMLARFGGHGIGGQNAAGVQQAAQSAVKWEHHYDELLPAAEPFLSAHKENFAFTPQQIAANVTWKLKITEKASTRFGALDLTPTGGKKRRFYLVGRRTPEEVAALIQKALPQASVEGGPLTVNAFAPLNNASRPALNHNGPVVGEPVYKKPNWPIILISYVAAIGFSLVIADQFNFWLPLAACVIAPMFYKMMRFSGMFSNYYSRSAEQLKRDRAAQDAQR